MYKMRPNNALPLEVTLGPEARSELRSFPAFGTAPNGLTRLVRE